MAEAFDAGACFARYTAQYQALLERYYPALGRDGFTERNQSVRFAQAVSALYPDAFAWYEAALDTRPRQHLDAVIFVPRLKATLLVEAKRFSNPHSKLKSMAADLARLCEAEHHRALCALLREGYRQCAERIYGVFLADVWLETDMKRTLYEAWGDAFLESMGPLCPVPPAARARMGRPRWLKTREKALLEGRYQLLALAFESMA